MELTFEWDEEKNERNMQRRGISFEEAMSVFGDPHSVTIFDNRHFEDEDRFIDIGLSNRRRLLVVVYTERADGIRIISCRKTEPPEQRQYERHKA